MSFALRRAAGWRSTIAWTLAFLRLLFTNDCVMAKAVKSADWMVNLQHQCSVIEMCRSTRKLVAEALEFVAENIVVSTADIVRAGGAANLLG